MLAVVIIFFMSSVSYGQLFYYNASKKSKGIDFSITQLTLTDLTQGGGVPTLVPPMLSGELMFRLYHTHYLTIIGANSLSSTAVPNLKSTSFGLGIKSNLPGFFFFKSRKRHLLNKAKSKWLNTAVYAQILSTKTTNSLTSTTTEGYESVFGIEIDAFLFSPLYLKLNFQINNRLGDYFTAMGVGLGWEF